MRIPSGKTDQVIYFVAVDSTDLKTRETGLSSFTVYRSRNNGAAAIYTTPTVTELSAGNMPGVYSLLIDEDTTIGASSDSEEYVVHITQASMAPVTRSIELYRRDTTTGRTLAVDATFHALSDVDTIKTNPVVNGGTATFPTNATLASTTNITAGTITTATNVTTVNGLAANVITAASINADAITDAKVAADVTIASVTGAVGSVTAAVTVGAINANVITAASINADAITAAKIADGAIDALTFAAGAINAAAIANGAIDAATFAAGAIDATALAADAVTEIWAGSTAPTAAAIADAVLDEDMTAHQTQGSLGQAIGDPVADANTIYKAVVTDATGATVGVDVVAVKAETLSIQSDTDNIQTRLPGALVGGRMDSDVAVIQANAINAAAIAADAITAAKIATNAIDADALAADAVTEIQTGLATAANLATTTGYIDTEIADIQSRLPAALISGRMNSDVEAINDSTVAADVLAILNGATVVYQGTVTGAATTTTLVDAGLTQADTDWWKGRIIIFTSVITMQATDITGFTPATDTLTFTAVTQAPTGATYMII